MSKIRPLPAKFVNMIAAGEVVERPASVIKELIENSIDAGATSLSVSLRDAGCAELIVEDDGRGIPRSEVPIAFVRHATSKFTAEDLLSFSFLGFRGEALASIAAVARVEMETCHAGVATTATIDGAQKITLRPGRITQGTRIAVRELFYATPVRLNFLKTKKTENGYNRDVFNHLALTNPNVAFRYYEEDILVKDAPLPLSDTIPIAKYKDSGEGLDVSIGESVGENLTSHGMKLDALRQRCEAILGRGFVGHALDCVATRDGYHVEGLISTPTWNRVRSDHIFISVNGRIVRDRALANAVKFAYRDTLARDKFPVAVLHLHVPSLEVDVNVSPSKTEMRFRQLPVIRSLIKMAVES
nr:DNA mismatch repair endonuclease MutL [Actinomycetes bacterium]